MKILYVTPRFPYPPIKGDQAVAYYRLRHLSERHEITLVSLYEKESELEGIANVAAYCSAIHTIKLTKLQSLMNAALRVPFSALPLQMLYYHSAEFRRSLSRLLETGGFDLVHAFMLRIVPALEGIRTPVVLDLNDSMQLNFERRVANERLPKRAIFQEELRRIASFERELGHRFPQLIVVSEIDKAYFPTGTVHAIPLGVETDRFSPGERPTQDRTLLFSGNMGYAPNIQAVTWFVENCLPQVREAIPAVKLVIAGANPPQEVRALTDRGPITVTGFVDSMVDVMRQAHVSIAPMQSGSGMQFKILEAMSCGLPVVTTRLGLASIKAQPGVEILVEDDPQAYADAIVRLLRDSSYALEVGDRARSYVVNHHSWEHAAEQVEMVYRSVLDAKPDRLVRP